MSDPKFAEIYMAETSRGGNWDDGGKGLVIDRVLFDGQEFHLAHEAPILIDVRPGEDLVKVNLTVLAKRVVIEESTKQSIDGKVVQ